MARRPRIYYPGAFYHVITKGNQRQRIFEQEVDFKTYLSYLSEYKSKYSFFLYAYVLMRNHIHLLVEVKETSLSKIMQVLQFRYTRYFNKRYRQVGHLFQGRYKAIVCDRNSYLLELVRYIHLNPVRVGLVKLPEEYPWSSHLSYVGKRKDNIVDLEFVLSQFSNKRAEARRVYHQFILDGLDVGHQEKYYKVKDQRFLGEDEFIESIECLKRRGESFLLEIPLEEIIREVVCHTGISEDRLFSLTRDRRGALGRSLVTYLARKLTGRRVKEIAESFNREPMTMSLGVKKIENLLKCDRYLASKIEIMENNLRKRGKKKYFITNA